MTDYIEGTMTWPDRMSFEQHLARCDGCTNYLYQMRRTIELAGTLKEEWIPSNAKQQLLQAFQNWRNDPRAKEEG